MKLDRRRALVGGLALGGAAAMSLPGCGRGGRRPSAGPTLLLVELFGGNDGLSTVVPAGERAYAELRPRSAVAADLVLPLADGLGLHPSLVHTARRFGAGEVAIVQGAGYPDPVYSHFRALEIWHTASARGRASGDGWIGRLRTAAWPEDERAELVVHVGPETPYSVFCQARPALTFTRPASFQWHGAPETRALLQRAAEESASGEANPALAQLRTTLGVACATSERVRAIDAAYRPRVEYPGDYFGNALRTAAALLQSDLGARVVSVQLGGFDTHGGTMKAKCATLLATLDRGLDALLRDLAGTQAGEELLVLAYSEFGRRAAENESGGTDHGAAGPMLLYGPRVRGGLYGAHPHLSELDADGNLVFTTDFRRVYATVVEQWFELAPERVLGAAWPSLPLLRV